MKTKVHLSFNTEQRPWSFITKLFSDTGCQAMAPAGPNFLNFYSVDLDESDPRLQRFQEALSNSRIEWLQRRDHIFTAVELEAAPLLCLMVLSVERGPIGAEYGTEFDLSGACPQCGTGAVQTSPLYLKPYETPKRRAIFQTYDHTKVVSTELAQALTEARVTGLELRRARSYRTLADLPWFQLIAETELPPMSPSSEGILRENPCPTCGRDGYFGNLWEPAEIEYLSSQVALDTLPDVAHTYECFGNSMLRVPFTRSIFARPLLLVKPKVLRVFREQKVRKVKFIPVRIVESD